MIKHIVLFKLSDNSPENCARTADILRSMDGKVDLLRGIVERTRADLTLSLREDKLKELLAKAIEVYSETEK